MFVCLFVCLSQQKLCHFLSQNNKKYTILQIFIKFLAPTLFFFQNSQPFPRYSARKLGKFTCSLLRALHHRTLNARVIEANVLIVQNLFITQTNLLAQKKDTFTNQERITLSQAIRNYDIALYLKLYFLTTALLIKTVNVLHIIYFKSSR